MERTIVCGRYEWDEEKNRANIRKHGISFEEVLPMFDDPLFWERHDESHSDGEMRFIGIAPVAGLSIVVACFVERSRIRMISARRATSKERKGYYARLEGSHPQG